MAKYVEEIQFRKYAFIEEGDESVAENIELALDAAEEAVSNDLDCATLEDYENENGLIPAPLVKAILMRALQEYDSPDDLQHSGVTVMNGYQRLIKPYVRLTK